MSNLKNWREDIGIDEVNDNCFHCQIVDDLGSTVAIAVGETADECNEISKLIATAPELLNACKQMIEAFNNAPVEWLQTQDVMDAEIKIRDAINKAVVVH